MTSPEFIAELQVRRKFYISVTNKQTNAAKALVRRALGQNSDDKEASRKASSERAARIVSAALNGKPQKAEDQDVADMLAFDLLTIAKGIEPFTEARHNIELDMKRAVRNLPVYAWVKGVKGLGELGLAVIIGEAGDLSGYPKKGHLWKRFGLAPFEGKAFSTWRREGGLTAEDWTDAGYSPRRRAEIYAVISDPLSKSQIRAKEKSEGKHGDPLGPYGEIYVARQFRTDEAHPDWTPMHKRMDALRVMTKYLLRDLWREWNGRKASFSLPEMARTIVPTVHTDGRNANRRMPKEATDPLQTVHLIAAE